MGCSAMKGRKISVINGEEILSNYKVGWKGQTMNLNQVTVPALDIEISAAFYRDLGLRQIVSAPHYARFECPSGNATFSIHKVDSAAVGLGVVVYFECADLDAQVALLQKKGFEFSQMPTDQAWLWREARLSDPSGNALCLYWAGENRRNPPWRIDAQQAHAGNSGDTGCAVCGT